jgi:hypothetical protein
MYRTLSVHTHLIMKFNVIFNNYNVQKKIIMITIEYNRIFNTFLIFII